MRRCCHYTNGEADMGKLKITEADFADLKEALDCRIKRLEDYPTYGSAAAYYAVGGMTAERFRWDLFHSAVGGTSLLHRLYAYLNDANIDAALVKITGIK